MPLSPPMPAPIATPMRSAASPSIAMPESSIAIIAAATPYSTNGSIFLTSFGATHRVASKPFTSPAIRVGNDEASKWVIGPMPERPWTIPSQLLGRSLPSGERMPSPVTATRRFDMCPAPGCKCAGPQEAAPAVCHGRPGLLLDVRLDVVDRLLHGGDLLGFLVRDLALELFLERHHQLDGVERIRAQVVDERGAVGDLVFLDAQLFDNDLLDALFDGAHGSLLLPGVCSGG